MHLFQFVWVYRQCLVRLLFVYHAVGTCQGVVRAQQMVSSLETSSSFKTTCERHKKRLC